MATKDKIGQAMKEAGLTQDSLAKKLGIKRPSISTWITGKRNPTVSTLKRIAEATGKPFHYFFDSSTKMGDNTSIVVGHNNTGSSSDIELLKKDMELIKSKLENLELRFLLSEKKR